MSHSVNQTDTRHSVSFGSQVRVTTYGASRDSSSAKKTPAWRGPNLRQSYRLEGDRSHLTFSIWIRTRWRHSFINYFGERWWRTNALVLSLSFSLLSGSELALILQWWIIWLSSWLLCILITLSQCKIPWLYKWVSKKKYIYLYIKI